MSDRQRTTWPNDGDRTAEVLPVERAASAHPATPDEGAAHPANQPDPDEHKYENGDTSSWAEDPTTGPYPNSAHPATPDEGAAHPAHKAAADAATAKEAASQLRASVTKKASKTVRIAEALLIPLMRRAGIDPTSEKAAGVIENQALDFLDIPDEFVSSTLNRLAELAKAGSDDEEDDAEEVEAGKKADDHEEEEDEETEASKKAADEALLRRLLAEEDEEDEDDAGKEAAERVADDRLAQILEAVQGLGSRLTSLETGAPVVAGDDDAEEDEDEALLAQMLNQEATVAMDEPEEDIEAMLHSMVENDAMYGDEAPVLDEVDMIVDAPDTGIAELDVQMGDIDDPMGLMAETELTADEAALLGTLFASDGSVDMTDTVASADSNVDPSLLAAATADANKEAAERKPRAKKASSGVSSLGNVTGSGTGNSEIDELSKLWPSAPDVSGVFG